MIVRKILYGSAFAVALPALLVLWAGAAAPNVSLPAFGGGATGPAIALVGLVLVAGGMLDLLRFGGGLPMNAFPPRISSSAEYSGCCPTPSTPALSWSALARRWRPAPRRAFGW